MKIKALIAALILSLAPGARVHSLGMGVQANVHAGNVFAPGVALLLSPSDYTHIAVNWFVDFDKVSTVGYTMDVVPINIPLIKIMSGSFNINIGIGIYSNVTLSKSPNFDGGIRAPAGFSLFLGDKAFEVFANIAPSWEAFFAPQLRLSSKPFFPIALGTRIWFR